MILILDGERPISWNVLYSGKHWGARKKYADEIHEKVFYTIRESYADPIPFDSRVHITVRAFFNKSPLDPCNIPAKIYIDGMHGLIIHDDTMEYVASVTTESHMDKENPRVEIEIVRE